MSEQEKKCIKLQEDYGELVKAKGEFDVMLADIKKEKVNTSNIDLVRKKVSIAKIKKEEVKIKMETFIPKIIREIIENEQQKLTEFFGEEIVVPRLPKEITKERIEKWQKQGFELHYLPNMDMGKKKYLDSWKKQPNGLFRAIDENRADFSVAILSSGWILIDGREQDGLEYNKIYCENDVLSAVIKELRNGVNPVIEKYKYSESRFHFSWDELNKKETKKAFADILLVRPEQIKLPRAIEWNVIGNIHHPNWGDKNTYEWFGDKYYFGGYSDHGGLSDVYTWELDGGNRCGAYAFRLLICFPEDEK